MRNSNLIIVTVALIIAVMGILSIYSSTYQKEGDLWKLIYQRQILWVILGLALFFGISRFNYRNIWDVTYLLYAAIIFLLFLVFLLGVIRLGAQRWIKFGWLNFQPSELAKLITIIFIARYFSKKSADNLYLLPSRFGIFKGLIFPSIFVAIPAALIIEQPDLGSALLVFFVFLAMLYLSGIKRRYLVLVFAAIIILAPLLWHFLHDYQKQRLIVFLNPNIDPLGAGYTVIQSKIAIGSGGFLGKGWLSGTQSQLHFLPESHTDFVFGTFAEEWGFFGVSILLWLYYILIKQGFTIAQRTADQFGKLLASGITLMLTIQIFVNIAMNLGLAPVVGVPLPLMSYGGSSILVTFIALGILVNIGKTRSMF